MNEVQEIIRREIRQSISVKEKILQDESMLAALEQMALAIINAIKSGGKILICGNGGSAADALHFASELVGRFRNDRIPIPAIALNADAAAMTSISNDYGFRYIYSRQIEALMCDKDILIAISTSGNSDNIAEAINSAHEKGGKVFLLTGGTGGKAIEKADLAFAVPSDITSHIQEAHECVYHIICGIVEDANFTQT